MKKATVSVNLKRTLKTADYESIQADFGMVTEIDSSTDEALKRETVRLFKLVAESQSKFEASVRARTR
jgi:hypothetical protein